MSNVPLQQVLDLVAAAVDLHRIALGKERQAQVWLGQSPDYAPLLLGHTERFFKDLKEDRTWKMAEHELRGGAVCREMWDYPHYTFLEQQDDPEKMLYEMLWEILSWARSGSDAMLSVRPYYLRSIECALGMRIERNEETHASTPEYLPVETVYDLDTTGVFERGLFPKIAECIDLMKQKLPEGVHIFPGDTVGPLCLAEAIRGNEIWYDFYDRPEDVHELIAKCRKLCMEAAYWYKEKIGDPRTVTYHGSLYQARGGARVVNDSFVNLSPEMHRQFVIDAIREIFREFDGGWFHSCGSFKAHLDDLLAMPEMTTINFGNPEQWEDLEGAIRKIKSAGKVYYGAWTRQPDEPMEAYLRRAVRLLGPERNGMILFLQGDGPFDEPQKTMDLWQRLQDEEFPRN